MNVRIIAKVKIIDNALCLMLDKAQSELVCRYAEMHNEYYLNAVLNDVINGISKRRKGRKKKPERFYFDCSISEGRMLYDIDLNSHVPTYRQYQRLCTRFNVVKIYNEDTYTDGIGIFHVVITKQ